MKEGELSFSVTMYLTLQWHFRLFHSKLSERCMILILMKLLMFMIIFITFAEVSVRKIAKIK